MMIGGWESLVDQLAGSPLLQGTVIALATFVLEDPVTIGSGLLVAEGKISFILALCALTTGIAVGDFGLYLLGRFVGDRSFVHKWISKDSLEAAGEWTYGPGLVGAILLARFVPGTRLATYVAAGVVRAPAMRFFVIAVGASITWTFLLLAAALKFGEAALPMLGEWRWPAAGVLVMLIAISQYYFIRRRKRLVAKVAEGDRIASLFEFWPPWLFYIPVSFYYIYLSIRYRSLTLPTCANPSIYSGGMIGESKSQILGLVPEEIGQRRLAKHVLIPAWVSGNSRRPGDRFEAATDGARLAGLNFPFVVKPDQGQRGAGVCLVRGESELREYLASFPETAALLLQEFAEGPLEAGVFYYRIPGEDKGTILSITLKEFPQVVGDGSRRLRELVIADPRARLMRKVYFRRHLESLDQVPGDGEIVPLVFAGNHCQGAVFRDGKYLATPELLDSIHQVATSMPDFYFGRIDMRYRDDEILARGKGFKIVEINGASSEVTHIWDPSNSLFSAYKDLFDQFRILFLIGDANRRRGCEPLGAIRLLRDWFAYLKVSRLYPVTH